MRWRVCAKTSSRRTEAQAAMIPPTGRGSPAEDIKLAAHAWASVLRGCRRASHSHRARASQTTGPASFARVQRLAPPRPPTHSPARLQARPLRRTHEARSLWPGGAREARHHRFRRQNPRSVAHRHRHRRRHARLRRTGRYQEGQYQPAEGGAGQAAARRLHRQCAQLHRDRVELFGSRRRGRHADPEGADHLQQGADLDLRAERQHHHPEGIR